MPELPFTRDGLVVAVNLAALWVMLEAFGFRPFAKRPPWRSPGMELWMWFLLGLNAVVLASNLAAWLVIYLYHSKGT
jgi:hypothetical protein